LYIDARISGLGRRPAVGYANRRSVVAVAEMRVQRVVPGVAHRGGELRAELGARALALRGGVVNRREAAPRRDALEILHRLGAGTLAGRAALVLVARKQMLAAPALVHGGELPADVDRVADAGVHAEAAVGRHDMHRVARQ